MDMVLTALDDVELSREICNMCRKSRIPVNAADIPDSCDFYFGSQIRDGPLQVMISTNGNGPKMANLVKKRLQNALTGIEGPAITKVGELRAQLKARAPGVGGEVGKRRMKWMTSLCNIWGMEELALLDNNMIQQLLDDGWEKDRVPTFVELKGTCLKPGFSRGISPTIGPVLGFATGILLTLSAWWIRRR
ncbi:Siroheme biosynthesis protein met8 [Termitomyces sp. J132]|nr:Siroheme biosynthesis protein met8 [Termitomyces sp. J132]